MAKSDLYEEARSAGFDLPEYDDITTSELKAMLKSDEPKSEKTVVVNERKNPVRMRGLSIAPKGSVTLTEKHKANEYLMKCIEHGVKTGVLSYGK